MRAAVRLAALTLGVLCPLLVQAASNPPGAGQLLQQLPSTRPVAPRTVLPPIHRARRPAAPVRSSQRFLVRRIVLTGNTLIPAARLRALLAADTGRLRTLAQITALATRLSAYYHAHGYPLSRVYVPAQTVTHGVVYLVVLEGRYGQVTLHNTSRVDHRLLQATLAPLRSGALIATRPLNQRLMLLTTIPGVVVAPATLSPGTAVGTSDLRVTTTAGPRMTGGIQVDNYGNRYTGRKRLGAEVTVNNPLHAGDQLTLQGLVTDARLRYGQLSYSALVDGIGTRVGASYGVLEYHLGGAFSALGAHGSARNTGLTVSQPFYLSPVSVSYGALQMNRQQLNDTVTAAGVVDQRHIDSVTPVLYGNRRDAFLDGGVTSYAAAYTTGRLAFDDAAAAAADQATARTAGRFSKMTVNLTRLQQLPLTTTLALTVNTQWAFDNLDTAQQLVLGGPDNLPGYPQGEITGDSGYDLTEALRHDVPIPLVGRWQAQLFADEGAVVLNQTLWNGFSGPNHAALADVGVALRW